MKCSLLPFSFNAHKSTTICYYCIYNYYYYSYVRQPIKSTIERVSFTSTTTTSTSTKQSTFYTIHRYGILSVKEVGVPPCNNSAARISEQVSFKAKCSWQQALSVFLDFSSMCVPQQKWLDNRTNKDQSDCEASNKLSIGSRLIVCCFCFRSFK